MYRENLKIAASANIVKNASVVGQVEIGAESCVLFQAVLRGDGAPITIGDHTNIQDNCTVRMYPFVSFCKKCVYFQYIFLIYFPFVSNRLATISYFSLTISFHSLINGLYDILV